MSDPCNRGCTDKGAARCWPLGTVRKGPCSCACHLQAEPLTPSEVTAAKIVITRRFADYHAAIDGTNGCKWGCGKTIDEAVGSLVRNHPGAFGAIVDLEKAGAL